MKFLILILIFSGCYQNYEVVRWDFTEFKNRECKLRYKKKEDQQDCIERVMRYDRNARENIKIKGDKK